MASQAQHDSFKAVFDEEQERYGQLEKRANLYLTIITFYLGAIVFKIDDLLKFALKFNLSVFWFLAIGAILGIALLLVVRAISIREYEGLFSPKEEIKSYGTTPPSDSDFFDKRLADFAVATERNAKQNNRVARLLQFAAWFLFLAVLLQIIIFGVIFTHAKATNVHPQVTEVCSFEGESG